MKDRLARYLSWGATLLCAAYLVWGSYQFSRHVPALAQLLAGLGSEIPFSTRFVIGTANFMHRLPGAFLVLILLVVGLTVGKELVLREHPVTRLAITFLIFLVASWFFDFAVSAMLEPLVRIMGRIE